MSAGKAMAVSAASGSAVPAADSAPPAEEKMRRRSPRSWMMTWNLAILIKFLLPCK